MKTIEEYKLKEQKKKKLKFNFAISYFVVLLISFLSSIGAIYMGTKVFGSVTAVLWGILLALSIMGFLTMLVIKEYYYLFLKEQ